jgi:hypothetical protein
MKVCKSCLIEINSKSKSLFCVKCNYHKYKDKIKETRDRNRDNGIRTSCTSLDYRRKASIKYRENNFERWMYLALKGSAKKRNLEFNLLPKDIIIPKYCPYLGIELTRNIGKGKTQSNPSVDRIDNTLGYVKGNIEVISDLANSMKRECTIEQLITFAENVIKKHSK